jgi:hypothetical protein
MIRVWSFYSLETGEFTGRRYGAATDLDLKSRTPNGCGAIEGSFDPETQRVDLESLDVIDHVAVDRMAARERREAIRAAQAERATLEIEQIRSISSLLDNPSDREAREHYERRRTRLDELREVIFQNDDDD